MNAVEILERFDAFRGGVVNIRREVIDHATAVRLEAGQLFFCEGQVCAYVALVGSGSLRVFKTGTNGRELTLYHVHQGETCLVNVLSAFRQVPAPAAAVAESVVEALAFPAELFRRWVQQEPALQDYVFESIARRMVGVMTLVEEVTFQKMDRRLAELLLRLSERPGGRLRELPATHEQLAAELGTVREVVSRLLKEFERAGAVSLGRGHIEVCDPESLRRLAADPWNHLLKKAAFV
jgi:CRP/FNR family transcriptional regulator, anaerobic regulatory protein